MSPAAMARALPLMETVGVIVERQPGACNQCAGGIRSSIK
jgi:hypothetical protein